VRLCGDDVRLLAVVTALVIWRRELVLVDGLEPERILGAPLLPPESLEAVKLLAT